jgi:sugar phosphate isomerase/epimerase
MLNLAIRGHDLHAAKDIQSLAGIMADYDVHYVQLAMEKSFPNLVSDRSHLNIGMGLEIASTLKQSDVQVAILSSYINMVHPDLDVREELLLKFEAYLKYAKYFNAPLVVSETGAVHAQMGYTEDNFTEEAFQEVVTVVKRLVKTGERYGVQVGIEPGLNHPLHTLEKTKRLIEAVDSDYLSIVLDPTNLIDAETYHNQVALVEEAYDLFGDKIEVVHFKDFLVEDDQIVPTNMGEGIIQRQAIIDVVQSRRPGTIMVLEHTQDEAIKRAVEILNTED